MFCKSNIRRRRAFSLVEIMIVIVIMGLLAGVITVNVRGYLVRSRQAVALQDIRVICDAIDNFNAVTTKYPSNDEGLEILVKSTDKLSEPLLNPTNLKDPWGNPYQYIYPATNGKRPYKVMSLGSDFSEGGDGEAADVSLE